MIAREPLLLGACSGIFICHGRVVLPWVIRGAVGLRDRFPWAWMPLLPRVLILTFMV